MRDNKKNQDPAKKTDDEKHVETFMGLPFNEAKPAGSIQTHEPGDVLLPETYNEPTSAPIISNNASDEVLNTPVIDKNPEPEVTKTVEPAPTEEDPTVDTAVDDIVAKESDEVLATQDEELAKAFEPETPKQGLGAKIKNFLKAWWNNPKARWATIVILVLALLATAIIPVSRYFVLNTAGVRASTSVHVVDNSTKQPLKNVTVSVGLVSAVTDSSGNAKLNKVKLGSAKLTIKRRAFAPVERSITLGLGSNPLGNFELIPTGTQYSFVLSDFMSGKPITKAEASTDSAEAQADDKGKIVLTVDGPSDGEIKVIIKADTYRDEVLTFGATEKTDQVVQMVPSRKHAFISKRSGKYDLYSIDVDGKNEKLLLPGSGTERDGIVVAPHPTDDLAAFVSTRDNVRNKDGYLLSTLSVIDTKTGEKKDIGQSEQIQIVDWINDRLVYVQIAAGASANDPKRQRLMTYDIKSEEKKEIASTNYFNDVLSASGAIYYAPNSAYQNGTTFYRVNADGTNRQALLNKEVFNIIRIQYDTLSLSVGQDWYSYKLGELQAGKISGAPASLKNRLYRDSPDGSHSLWIDDRDGKSVLLNYNLTGDKKDVTLRTQSGLNNPTYWLNDSYVVYRIHTDQESADYVLNLAGGQPRKIRDVTNTSGVDQWYYYQ
jgi:hypothetical protein